MSQQELNRSEVHTLLQPPRGSRVFQVVPPQVDLPESLSVHSPFGLRAGRCNPVSKQDQGLPSGSEAVYVLATCCAKHVGSPWGPPPGNGTNCL